MIDNNLIDARIFPVIPICNSPQTVARGLANKRSFRLTFRANTLKVRPTLAANEPTLGSGPLLVRWFGSAIQGSSAVSVSTSFDSCSDREATTVFSRF
jgi:hypothetical protein